MPPDHLHSAKSARRHRRFNGAASRSRSDRYSSTAWGSGSTIRRTLVTAGLVTQKAADKLPQHLAGLLNAFMADSDEQPISDKVASSSHTWFTIAIWFAIAL